MKQTVTLTFAQCLSQARALMADGRERTATDVALNLGTTPAQAGAALAKMAVTGECTAEMIGSRTKIYQARRHD
jgi:hypothetical protein